MPMLKQVSSWILCVALMFTGYVRIQTSTCATSTRSSCCCASSCCAKQEAQVCHCADHGKRTPDAPNPAPPRLPDLAPSEANSTLALATANGPELHARMRASTPHAPSGRTLNVMLRTFLI